MGKGWLLGCSVTGSRVGWLGPTALGLRGGWTLERRALKG